MNEKRGIIPCGVIPHRGMVLYGRCLIGRKFALGFPLCGLFFKSIPLAPTSSPGSSVISGRFQHSHPVPGLNALLPCDCLAENLWLPVKQNKRNRPKSKSVQQQPRVAAAKKEETAEILEN